MAKPFQRGNEWAFRLRIRGQDIFRSGFPTEAAARREMSHLRTEIEQSDKAQGYGPFQTSLAVAFSDYARQRLPYLKAARQDAQRINTYLRALGLPIVQLQALEHPVEDRAKQQLRFYNVTLVREAEQVIPNSLKEHRTQQDLKRRAVDRARKGLASLPMAEVSMRHVQDLVDAMRDAGIGAATIGLERALLRQLFNHARTQWKWSRPVENPAGFGLNLPKVDNARTRILTQQEWEKLYGHLQAYSNRFVYPLVCVMLDTAMRSCEPLTHARWGDVDWEHSVLRLTHTKTGKRDVPLNIVTMRILEQLKSEDENYSPDARIFNTSYEALKKAWKVCCTKAGVTGINIHDLRHTSATRYSLEFGGDKYFLKVITGHKTEVMLDRYINITAEQVALAMRKQELPPELAPAGYKDSLFNGISNPAAASPIEQDTVQPTSNVVHVQFGKKAA